jgi:lipopolysaccharide transport system permease protein
MSKDVKKLSRTIVEAGKDQFLSRFLKVFTFRDLFYILAYRDYRARYAQTFLGLTWAIIQPLVTLAIFILVFDKAANISTGNIPYPVFALSGIALWTYISFVLSQSGTSLIASQDMVKKIYFPRLILPLSKSLVGSVDLLLSMTFLAIMMIIYQLELTWQLIVFPIVILLLILTAVGPAIWLSALSIRYRDFQHTVPFLVQIGLYASPIAYPSSLIISKASPAMSFVYYLNPVAGLLDIFRWSLFNSSLDPYLVSISMIMSVLIFISGIIYFQKMEQTIADYI